MLLANGMPRGAAARLHRRSREGSALLAALGGAPRPSPADTPTDAAGALPPPPPPLPSQCARAHGCKVLLAASLRVEVQIVAAAAIDYTGPFQESIFG